MSQIYSVSQINSYLKRLIGSDMVLRSVEVRGELSNVKYHSSGYIYFTLKDKKSLLPGVMFAAEAAALEYELDDGMKVVVSGRIGVYEQAGKYQLYADQIRKEGSGELYERFLKLKNELEEMGMFAEEYKQPLQKYIRTLGVVTAPTGAVIHDIITVSRRRNPFIEIYLYPVQVQGEGAAESIAEGIRFLDDFGVDTIIVGRGGGSIEDLWAFNEEITARAIFECRTPIISAVGHETDTTIADLVADLRAPTPSAAAELAVFDFGDFSESLSSYRHVLISSMNRRLSDARMRLENTRLRLERQDPRMVIRENRLRLGKLEDDLHALMKSKIDAEKSRAALLQERLKGLSPQEKLETGYAYVGNVQGKPVKSVEEVSPKDELILIMKDGRIYTDVRKVEK